MSKGQSSDDMMRPLQNEPDEEIEFIMRRKFLELQKKLLKSLTTREEEDPEKIVRRNLTKKAREVLDAALSQYPRITRRIIVALAQAIKRGEVETPIDAVTLYNTFKYLGIPVRLETKIRFYEKGRHIDLREKLKED